MGQHKGKKKADQGSFQRYWSENHRKANKIRRIKKCNGQAYLDWWLANYGA